jgi:hypothetical protein
MLFETKIKVIFVFESVRNDPADSKFAAWKIIVEKNG